MVDVLKESRRALKRVNRGQILGAAQLLLRAERVFCIGNGGGAAHATHFASDLRKIAHMQSFSFDNVAEMTARINDDGWENAWRDWLSSFHAGEGDVLFVFSVGGGTSTTSLNFSRPTPYMVVLGIVGAGEGGWVQREGWPIIVPSTSTPVIEGCQSVIAHHLVEQLCG